MCLRCAVLCCAELSGKVVAGPGLPHDPQCYLTTCQLCTGRTDSLPPPQPPSPPRLAPPREGTIGLSNLLQPLVSQSVSQSSLHHRRRRRLRRRGVPWITAAAWSLCRCCCAGRGGAGRGGAVYIVLFGRARLYVCCVAARRCTAAVCIIYCFPGLLQPGAGRGGVGTRLGEAPHHPATPPGTHPTTHHNNHHNNNNIPLEPQQPPPLPLKPPQPPTFPNPPPPPTAQEQ